MVVPLNEKAFQPVLV